jgi:hypothetical protein
MDSVPKMSKWAHTVCANYPTRTLVCVTSASNDRHLYTLIRKYVTINFYLVVFKINYLFLAFLNSFRTLYARKVQCPVMSHPIFGNDF